MARRNGVNALSRAGPISTPPLRNPSIYAGCRPCFCRYFSEYSDNTPKQGSKVGRALIVFFKIQFLEPIYISIIPYSLEETMDYHFHFGKNDKQKNRKGTVALAKLLR